MKIKWIWLGMGTGLLVFTALNSSVAAGRGSEGRRGGGRMRGYSVYFLLSGSPASSSIGTMPMPF